MKFSALYRVELNRLLRNRLTWLAAALTALAPLAGYSFYKPTMGDSMSALYMADPLLTGGLAGALLFAVLMLVSLDKPQRSGIQAVTDAIVSPLAINVARLLSVLTAALLTAMTVGLLYLPYTAWKLDIVFSLGDYLLSILLFLLSGPIMGALAAAMLWQVVRRLDVSLLAMVAALIFSRSSVCRGSFLAQWSVPLVSTLSDAFGSDIVWRTAIYSRLVWLCLLGGGWLLSLLCVRQYGKGLLGSFRAHSRRIALPLIAVVLVAGGTVLWQQQPFVDHSPDNWMELLDGEVDRYNEFLTLDSARLDVAVDSYLLGTMSGTATFNINNTSGTAQDLYFEINTGYAIRAVRANGQDIAWEDMHNDFISSKEVRCSLPVDGQIELVVEYGGMPQMWKAQEDQLSADVISKKSVTMTSKTLAPVVAGCALPADEATVELNIDLNSNFTPVGTGEVTKLADNGDGTTSWQVRDVGTDRLFLYAGDYLRADLDAGDGTSIPFYYSQKYRTRLENGALDLMEQAIQYCTACYGSRVIGQEGFSIIQTTAFNFGGFAVSGISGMGESYFSDENLQDPDKGPSSAEVLAHEIIHQWWGLGATLMDMEDEDWNDEGITVYTTYRFMCEVMGEAYARENYVEKWENTMADLAASYYQRHPEYVDKLPEKYQNGVRAAASSSNWYDGNALLIYRAAERIGNEQMDEVWAGLFQNGGAEMPPYISLGDFLHACGLEKGEVGRE